MAVDVITQKHLGRLRIRGAPATIPGSHGMVGEFDAEETWRQTCRALVAPLDKGFTGAQLRDAYAKLTEAAGRQGSAVFEEPMFALKGDPALDPPHKWEWEAVLPIRGPSKAEDGITTTRIQGGMHIASLTHGLGTLTNLYVYLFGKFLPAKRQQLMRPYILHKVVDGLPDSGTVHDDAMTIAIYVPAVLSIKPIPVPGEGEA